MLREFKYNGLIMPLHITVSTFFLVSKSECSSHSTTSSCPVMLGKMSVMENRRSYYTYMAQAAAEPDPGRVRVRRRQLPRVRGSEITLSSDLCLEMVNFQLTAPSYDNVPGFCLISKVGKKCCVSFFN